MPSYKDYYFCRNCSGVGNRGKRVWFKRETITTDPPVCPKCGKFLRSNPGSKAFKDRYDFPGEFQILVFKGALKT